MKILFICQANSGRSQMAMEYYNQLHPDSAASAGTLVQDAGQMLKDRPGAANAITVMAEHGVDIQNNVRKQLEPKMLDGYDKLVVMAEAETIPEWLKGDTRVEYWQVIDAKGQDLETTRKIRDEVRQQVQRLG